MSIDQPLLRPRAHDLHEQSTGFRTNGEKLEISSA